MSPIMFEYLSGKNLQNILESSSWPSEVDKLVAEVNETKFIFC